MDTPTHFGEPPITAMALKRKGLGVGDASPVKKFRRGVADESETIHTDDPFDDDASVSDGPMHSESDDPQVRYTDDGQKRARSEARRAWKYVCGFEGCGQRFNRPCRLEAHKRGHTNERPFACPHGDCDKTFPRKDHLTRHLKNTHPAPEAERFACDWEGCGKSFTTSTRLSRHRDVHDTKFYCTDYPPCKDVFRKQKTLDAHIKTKHMAVDPFLCAHTDEETGERCTKGYQTEQALRRHMLKSHGETDKERVFFCIMCAAPGSGLESVQTENGVVTAATEPLTFATYQELVAHSNKCHPPVCSECGTKFKKKDSLKSHIATVHAKPEDRPQFPCPHPNCDKVFNKDHNLRVHFDSVHEKNKTFFCDASTFQYSKKLDLKNWDGKNACGTPFAAKSALEQHVRTQHLRLKNRKETRKDVKSKKKPEPSALRLLTGIGDDGGRSVPCLVKNCEYRFFLDRDLRRHMRGAHQLPEHEIGEMIMERDALQGGQFWIGGMDEPMFESTETSIPQTPDPYQMYRGPIIPDGDGEDMKFIDPRLTSMDNPLDSFKLSLLDAEEAEMDVEMGLDELKMWNAQNGLPYNA